MSKSHRRGERGNAEILDPRTRALFEDVIRGDRKPNAATARAWRFRQASVPDAEAGGVWNVASLRDPQSLARIELYGHAHGDTLGTIRATVTPFGTQRCSPFGDIKTFSIEADGMIDGYMPLGMTFSDYTDPDLQSWYREVAARIRDNIIEALDTCL